MDTSDESPTNKWTLMIDATCVPAYIAYPTDVNLLNEAREKLEGIIDTLHPHTGDALKPRTYRKKARKIFLRFAKLRRPGKKAARKAIGQLLRYVARDLRHIENQLTKVSEEELSAFQKQWLETIKILFTQQKQMYDNNTHSVNNRIVSISQPHVRPIVRGKVNTPVEFGAKVSVSLIDGYVFIDKIGWEAYNEEALLKTAVETYKKQYSCYPEAVLADKIYRNRSNREYCKNMGIRMSGPRLGRPPKETNKAEIKQERFDARARNAIEGKFGEGKTKYGLNKIMARLAGTSETVIAISFLCMNINRRLRILFYRFFRKLTFMIYFNFIANFKISWVFG
jgi:DNA-directed RNA polymerase subunit E'/Rpb7